MVVFIFKFVKENYKIKFFPESKYRDWKNKTVEEFRDYYNEHCANMSRSEVDKIDKGFYQAVCKRKLLDQVFPESRSKSHKPNGYWKDFDNVKKPLEELIDKLGHFPSKSEIYNTNRSVYSAIQRYHSYISVKNQMGYFEREKELARILLEECINS